MLYQLKAVDKNFLDTAKTCFVVEQISELDQQSLWNAFADSSQWKHWFPDVVDSGYRTPPPYGEGTIRYSVVGKHRYEETMLHWQEPHRWSYRIDETTLAIAKAQVELTEFETLDNGKTLVRWTIATEPKLLLKLASPFMEKIMSKMLKKALMNLQEHLNHNPL